MRIVVDALPLTGDASIGALLGKTLVHLRAVAPEHEIVLFLRGFRAAARRAAARRLGNGAFPGAVRRTTRIPDRVLEWLWTDRSVRVPGTDAWLGRPDVFVSTVHFHPVLERGALVPLVYDLVPLRFPGTYRDETERLLLRLRRGVERGRWIAAISEATRRDLIELVGADPERVGVVYPGVDERFRPDADPDDAARLRRLGLGGPYVLYVGTMAPHKNVPRLLAAFRRLREATPVPHRLVLRADKGWNETIARLAEPMRARGELILLPPLPDELMPSLYRGADLTVLVSWYEGFGLPVAEALACGSPVVASSRGALPEVAGDAAVLVDPDDEEAIVDALHRVLTDASLRRELRTRGPLRARRFSWEAAARALLGLLEQARDER